jgi:hypothetical protein
MRLPELVGESLDFVISKLTISFEDPKSTLHHGHPFEFPSIQAKITLPPCMLVSIKRPQANGISPLLDSLQFAGHC